MSAFVTTGFRQLDRNFDKLRGKPVRRVVRKALNAAGQIVLREARKRVPVETGLLRKSLGKKVWTSRNKKVLVAIIGPRRGMKIVDDDGNARDPYNYAHLVELGTYSKYRKSGGPKAYLRPALDANRIAVTTKMRQKAAQEIENEARRLRK